MQEFTFQLSEREKFLAKLATLQDDEQRMDFIRELQVGELFFRSGCTVVHEPILDGKTPDWKIQRHMTEFLVEVTRLRNEDVISGNRGLYPRKEELRTRLHKLPFDARVHITARVEIEYGRATPFFDLDQIVHEVEIWLRSGAREPLVHEEFTFTKEDVESSGMIVTMDMPYVRMWNHNRFLKKMVEKLVQRRKLTTALPYIFVVIIEFDSGTTLRACSELLDNPGSCVSRLLWPRIRNGDSQLVHGVVLVEPDAHYWRVSDVYTIPECENEAVNALMSFAQLCTEIQGDGPHRF